MSFRFPWRLIVGIGVLMAVAFTVYGLFAAVLVLVAAIYGLYLGAELWLCLDRDEVGGRGE